jgi:hypothetical protein
MQESEVIIINGIPEQIHKSIVDEAFAYAIQSVAFTYNRLKRALYDRVIFITDGKIAEGLLSFFLKENGIVVDTTYCKTNYLLPDNNDFMYNGVEYDAKCYRLKNIGSNIMRTQNHINLPAAVFQGQFKNITYSRTATSSAFIFMFQGQQDKPMIQINIPNDVSSQIEYLTRKYYNKHIPFETKDEKQVESFPGRCQIKQNYYVYYVITAYANLAEDHQKFILYNAYNKGPLHFGRNFSIIKNNYLCPLTNLNSFASIFPQHLVKNGMKYGVFKTDDYQSILQDPVITADNTPITSPIAKQLHEMYQPTFF